jgi:hypothetical protein
MQLLDRDGIEAAREFAARMQWVFLEAAGRAN